MVLKKQDRPGNRFGLESVQKPLVLDYKNAKIKND
jgi:hypothetical protein